MDNLFITPGLRVDDNEAFGSQTTYKVSTAYLVKPIDARLKANWGTGFKAPSLYQLYSSYGNPDLSPEESESYDFGFERTFDRLSFGLTYFQNDFDNMIDWDPATWEFKNIERAETKGFELEAEFLPVKNLTIGASFTYIDTEDKETGLELLRRPEKQVGLNINWELSEGANINVGITYVGSRKDVDYTSYPYERIDLEEYTKVDLSLGWDLGDYQIFGRIENLLDEEYQEVYGFASEGLSFYAGVKTSF
jgi:vitamin B12 transporter